MRTSIKATPRKDRAARFAAHTLASFPSFLPKTLEIRRYSCVVLDNLTKKLTARLHDNLCAVLP